MDRAPGSLTTQPASSWISCCTTRFSRKSRRFSSCRLATDGRGGGTAGQALLRGASNEGHVLALHTATAGGHLSHTGLSDAELDRSLRAGMADIQLITGETPTLVRPPFWRFDERTLKAYHACGLLMLLTDISARDGVIYGWTI